MYISRTRISPFICFFCIYLDALSRHPAFPFLSFGSLYLYEPVRLALASWKLNYYSSIQQSASSLPALSRYLLPTHLPTYSHLLVARLHITRTFVHMPHSSRTLVFPSPAFGVFLASTLRLLQSPHRISPPCAPLVFDSPPAYSTSLVLLSASSP